MPVEPYMVLSTGHLTEESRDQLIEAVMDGLSKDRSLDGHLELYKKKFSPAADIVAAVSTGYGWYVYAHDDYEALKEAGVTENLLELYKYARSKGCCYLNFDMDAENEEGLPTYDW
jgi:hypothetical protein